MNRDSIARVRQSWARVLPRRREVATTFYRRLLTAYPDLRPLFKGDLDRQAALLVTMLNTVVSALDDPGTVQSLIERLGARHAEYGVAPTDYARFETVLLDTLAEALGADFDPATRTAWIEVYSGLAASMLAGAAGAVELCRHRAPSQA